eukprot:Awhi_evm1s14291
MMPVCGVKVYESAQSISPNIAYFMPKNTDLSQLIELAGPRNKCEVEENYLNEKLKTITAYYGDLVGRKTHNNAANTSLGENEEEHFEDDNGDHGDSTSMALD